MLSRFLVLVSGAFLVTAVLMRVNADLNATESSGLLSIQRQASVLSSLSKDSRSGTILLAAATSSQQDGRVVVVPSSPAPQSAGDNSSLNAAALEKTIRNDLVSELGRLNAANLLFLQNQIGVLVASSVASRSSVPETTALLPAIHGFSWNNDASISLTQGNITVTQGNITVGNTELFSNGNIGVNTLSPGATLDVNGTLNAGSSTLASLFSNGSSTVSNLNFSNATGTTLNLTNLTVSSCSGCGGVAGGLSGQLQYNNGGVFAGDTGLVWASSTKLFTLTGTSTFSGKFSIGTTTPLGVFNVAGATSTTYLSVLAGGLVGIGTSTPATTLSMQAANPAITFRQNTGQTFQIRNTGAFDIFDQTNNQTRLMVDTTGQFLVGTTTNCCGNGSKMFIFGGPNGANLDIMGDASIVGGDQAVVEMEGSDYGTPSGGQSSAALRYYGPTALGSTMGFVNKRLGILDFGNASTGLIMNSTSTPIVFATNFAERMRLTGNGSLVIGTTTAVGIFNIGSATTTNYFNVNQVGQVGIGTTTPAYRLVVGDRTTQADIYIPKGGLCVGASTSTCPATPQAGSIYAAATAINAIDLAENYPTQDASLEAGDLVAADLNNSEYVIKGTADTRDNLLGVVSTHPGVLLGSEVANSRPIALSGRVPVKVNLDGGPIHIGDRLTQSSVPGVAMRQNEPGTYIGIALQDYLATSTDAPSIAKISVFMHVGFGLGSPDVASASSTSIFSQFAQAVKNAITQIKDLVVNSLTASTVITNKLCLGSTCIGETDLQRILNNTGGSPAPPSPPPPAQPVDTATSTITTSTTSTPPIDTTTSTPPASPADVSTSVATSTP